MKRILATLAAAMVATPVLAHHPLAGAPMETFGHGLLSGIGHPVLGFDHLLFVAIVGVAALFTVQRAWAPFAYIAAMLVGCLAMSAGLGLPAKEVVIALSLVALGGVVLSGKAPGTPMILGLFAVFGLFHGSAFGEALVGQEATLGGSVLLGYLLGLGVIQLAIAYAAGWAVARLAAPDASASAMTARLSGAMVAGAGTLLLLEHAEGAAFALLGWA